MPVPVDICCSLPSNYQDWSLAQYIDAGEECGEVESHDESDGSEGVEILAVGQDDARGGGHDVGHEEGGVSAIIVRGPTIDEAACGQSESLD